MASYGKIGTTATATTSGVFAGLNRREACSKASEAISIPGEICKVVGSLGAIIGGAVMLFGLAQGNATGLGAGAVIGIVGAAAGAPVAALGSMATQAKRNTRLIELQVRSSIEGR